MNAIRISYHCSQVFERYCFLKTLCPSVLDFALNCDDTRTYTLFGACC